jgi:pre-mRNA-splicing factor ATP-dependent RNA helicase DHX15/PRP43
MFKKLLCAALLCPRRFAHLAQDGDTNPFTKKPFSAQYAKILAGRKKLPVFAQMDDFLETVRQPAHITHSSKTTRSPCTLI